MLRTFVIAACLAAAGIARAGAPPDPGVATFALIVGSNPGGPGQTDLHYAEDDARRVGALLAELGGYPADGVDIVVHPTPQVLRERLERLATRVQAERAAGRQVRLLFYYSGHARATAIDLGFEEMPLPELRQRLLAVPATLTIVVLDACQSGAFSRVKGAAPAADFSFNSRQHLDATGVVVLASSSGSELSQESEQLKSSYFTHHLLVGLRGAGDANRDGTVSIDEAYRYAYHQTLLATTETAVGGQHVTMEVELKGHGEVPLSYPRAATSAIELPAPLEGQAIVEDRKAHAVVAEMYKAKGAPVRIALAPGEYWVLVRHGDRLERCAVSTTGDGATSVDLAKCSSEKLVQTTRKGAGLMTGRTRFELTGLIGGERHDAYMQTLKDFGYEEGFMPVSPGIAVTATREVYPHVWIGGVAGYAGSPEYERTSPDVPTLRFSWTTTTFAGVARGEYPLTDREFATNVSAYAHAAVGLGIARTHFIDQDAMTTTETFYGASLAVGAGIHIEGRRGIGFSAGYQFEYAPIIDNLTGDTHAVGGHRATLGLSFSY